jgi:glycine cleavage system H protein
MVAILVALMFVGLILVDLTLQKLEARREARATASARTAPAALRPTVLNPWAVPAGVQLTPGHAWLRPLENATFRVGADALVAHALGAASNVSVPPVGEQIWAGQPLFKVRAGGRTVDLSSPVNGRVVAVNPVLMDRPGLVTEAPYGDGWVCAVHAEPPIGEEFASWIGEKAAAWMQKELQRLAEFLWVRFPIEPALGTTDLDGGLPAPGALAFLNDEAWGEFEREFLRS